MSYLPTTSGPRLLNPYQYTAPSDDIVSPAPDDELEFARAMRELFVAANPGVSVLPIKDEGELGETTSGPGVAKSWDEFSALHQKRDVSGEARDAAGRWSSMGDAGPGKWDRARTEGLALHDHASHLYDQWRGDVMAKINAATTYGEKRDATRASVVAQRLTSDTPEGRQMMADLKAFAYKQNITVHEGVNLPPGMGGQYVGTYPIGNPQASHSQEIDLNATNSPDQNAKTLAHEIAHSLWAREDTGSGNPQEAGVELAAYIVGRHYGLDSSQFSFPYIAGYAPGKMGGSWSGPWSRAGARIADAIIAGDAVTPRSIKGNQVEPSAARVEELIDAFLKQAAALPAQKFNPFHWGRGSDEGKGGEFAPKDEGEESAAAPTPPAMTNGLPATQDATYTQDEAHTAIEAYTAAAARAAGERPDWVKQHWGTSLSVLGYPSPTLDMKSIKQTLNTQLAEKIASTSGGELNTSQAGALVTGWIDTSRGMNGTALQLATQDKFGLPTLPATQDNMTTWDGKDSTGFAAARVDAKAFVDASYAAQQAEFARTGTSYVTLQRGVFYPDGKELPPEMSAVGDTPTEITTLQQPLKSWTNSMSKASDFAKNEYESSGKGQNGIGYVLTARVPVARIMGDGIHGLGDATDGEYVVIGGQLDMVAQRVYPPHD